MLRSSAERSFHCFTLSLSPNLSSKVYESQSAQLGIIIVLFLGNITGPSVCRCVDARNMVDFRHKYIVAYTHCKVDRKNLPLLSPRPIRRKKKPALYTSIYISMMKDSNARTHSIQFPFTLYAHAYMYGVYRNLPGYPSGMTISGPTLTSWRYRCMRRVAVTLSERCCCL